MSLIKIVYGIDLGTTNSAITRFENGKAVVKKNALQGDTTPSCVAYRKNGNVLVGSKARNQLEKDYVLASKKPDYKSNTYIEFKRLMGTDHKYECPNLGRDVMPEELSAEVLRELRKNVLDDIVTSAVITVPAMFNNTQKDATKRAAKMAGFNYVELIQEPVAASIAYGLDSKMKNAYWVVFDLGGGTFDAALMRIQDGIMQAIDTDGNNKLGGKDIDKAILDEIIIPYLKENYELTDTIANNSAKFTNMWKAKAEEIKIGLTFASSVEVETDLGDDYGTDDLGEELAISLTVTQQDLERISAPIYQKAIDITKHLLKRNNIDGHSLGALILVGGPTHSPIVRRMLREQITPNVDTSIDPMTCVAAGAAIYGSTIDVPEEIADAARDRSKVQLAVNYESSTVEKEAWVSVSLLKDKCDNFEGDYVNVEFVRTDGMFTSPQSKVDTNGDVINLLLKEDTTNVFDVRCYDSRGTRLECEPSQITIIQGIAGLGDAVIPMALGLGTLNSDNVEVFTPIEGLEKSRKLPSVGVIKGLRTPKEIRAGVVSDEVRMSLYQAEDATTDTRVIFCQRIYDVFLNGEDFRDNLPADSEINLRLHAERSGTINKFEVEIPVMNITLDLTGRMTNSKTSAPPNSFLVREFSEAKRRARELGNTVLESRLEAAEDKYNDSPEDRDTADATMGELQSICRELDKEYAMGAWEREEKRLRGVLKMLENDNNKYGNTETTRLVDSIKIEAEKVIARKDVQMAKDLHDQIMALDFRIAEVDFYIAWITSWNRDFSKKKWKKVSRARELVNKGLQIIKNNPTASALGPITDELWDLLPSSQRPDVLRH